MVKVGDYVNDTAQHVMTHDNTGPVISKCAFYFFWCHYIVFDHFLGQVQIDRATRIQIPTQPAYADMTCRIHRRRTLRNTPLLKSSLDSTNRFLPAGRGIGHQVLVEEGYAFPNISLRLVIVIAHVRGVGCVGYPNCPDGCCSTLGNKERRGGRSHAWSRSS